MRRLLLIAALLSCKSSSEEAPIGGASARYDVPANGTIAWKAIPFPNDLFLGADGTIDLNTLPRDGHDEPVWQATLTMLDKRKGFCASCSVYFPIDGELTGVPASIDAPSANDPIVFVDLEEKKLLPIRAFWNGEDHFVAVRPPPGVILIKKRKYAVALTTSLKAKDGQPLRASSGMNSNRAAPILNPAITALGALGIAREKIASLTTYTVDDVTSDVTAARAIAWAAPKPVAVLDKVWTADKLDELMGVPEEKLVGRRKAVDGHYAASHELIAMVLTGRFKAPRVITGKTPEIGAPLRDDSGALKAGALEDVNFLVTIPKGVDLSNAPVVVVHTGLTGTMSNGLILGDMLARAGAVGVSLEPALHGARAFGAKDERNVLRDIDGPDGLMEHVDLEVGTRFIGFVGFEPGKKAFPGYFLGVMTQQAADCFMGFRFVKEGDWSAIKGADPSLAALSFDLTKIGYFGISNGSVIGTKIAVAEPGIAAQVLNVPTGNFGETLFYSPGFRQVAGLSLGPALLIPIPDNVEHVRFDPLFDIYRWALDPMDPLTLSPYIARYPVLDGPRQDFLVQHAGHDELVLPLLADQYASSIGFPGIGRYDAAPVPSTSYPVSANFTLGGQTITAASARFDGAMHIMSAYAEEESSWESLVPPYKARTPKTFIKNPVVAVQKQLELFYGTRFKTGRAQIALE
jgi:hypothetical protein